MREKILALLTAKFVNVQGVRKDGLEQLANSLAITVTTEEKASEIVNGLTDSQVIEFIKSFRSMVDAETTAATKTHEENLKSKYDFVEKKDDPPTPSAQPVFEKFKITY
jgi:hypothetical protein